MVGRLANHELQKIDMYSQYLSGGMTETMTSLILPNISTEIQTWHLSKSWALSLYQPAWPLYFSQPRRETLRFLQVSWYWKGSEVEKTMIDSLL